MNRKLKQLRRERFLTLDQVYVKSRRRIQPSTVSKLERGILLMTDHYRRILSKVYGVSEADLT